MTEKKKTEIPLNSIFIFCNEEYFPELVEITVFPGEGATEIS